MCKPLWKKILLTVLVLCFGVQTALVYSDARSEPLSEVALAGRVLWHQHACQTCHQFYGQGGFLGPDLTNAASRVDSARLVSLLQVGSGQMPALHMDETEVAAMSSFLNEMDRPDIGRGQLRLGSEGEPGGAQSAFDRVVSEALVGDETGAATGFAAVQSRPCAVCHLPFRESPVGAPDLSRVAGISSPDSIEAVLTHGRPERGMPPPSPELSAEERSGVMVYLAFLSARRDELERRSVEAAVERSFDWRDVPWWEYR